MQIDNQLKLYRIIRKHNKEIDEICKDWERSQAKREVKRNDKERL